MAGKIRGILCVKGGRSNGCDNCFCVSGVGDSITGYNVIGKFVCKEISGIGSGEVPCGRMGEVTGVLMVLVY